MNSVTGTVTGWMQQVVTFAGLFTLGAVGLTSVYLFGFHREKFYRLLKGFAIFGAASAVVLKAFGIIQPRPTTPTHPGSIGNIKDIINKSQEQYSRLYSDVKKTADVYNIPNTVPLPSTTNVDTLMKRVESTLNQIKKK